MEETVKVTRKKVIQLDDNLNIIGEFDTAGQAASKTGIPYRSIQVVLHGGKRRAGGFLWTYGDEYEGEIRIDKNRLSDFEKEFEEDDALWIVIPAYNESDNILNVIRDWYPIVEAHSAHGRSRLLIIDDGSTDKTYEICMHESVNRPLLQVTSKKNSGHGDTVLYGYKYAITRGADYIFQTDSDGQTLPSEFEQFWRKREMYDMVIGWRKGRQDGASRVFATKTLKAVIRLCFGVTVTDANTPFRLMNADTLNQYIDMIPESFNLSNVLISVIFTKKGRRIKYIPITFRPRQGGVNSINLKKIFGIGRKALKDFRKMNKMLKIDAEREEQS